MVIHILKRIIALFLVCILAIPILTLSVFATDSELSSCELLDMGYWEVDGEITSSFQLDANQTGLFSTSNRIEKAFIYYAASGGSSITVNGSVLSPSYVASGIYSVIWEGNSNALRITPGTAIQIVSVRCELAGTRVVDVPLNYTGEVQNDTKSVEDSWNFSENYTSTSHSYARFELTVPYERIKKLDSLHLSIYLKNIGVTGINVNQGGYILPYTTGSLRFDGYPDSLTEHSSKSYFPLVIDVSSCRFRESDLQIVIYGNGFYDYDGYEVIFHMVSCKGVMNTPSANPISDLLVSIYNSAKTGFNNVALAISSLHFESVGWFSDIYDNITMTREYILNYLAELFSGEDAGDPDDFNSDVDQQETQFQEMVDTMETAPTVDLDVIVGELEGFEALQQSQTNVYYMSIISGLLQLGFLPYLFSFCGMLCIIGYLLYGKR